MNRVIEHISYLLTRHECVVIPGLGAFIVNDNPASVTRESDFIYTAPFRSLGFNQDLNINDGLLAASFARELNIPYQEAILRVKAESEEMLKMLNRGEYVPIPGIGSLHSESGHILFSPCSDPVCNIRNYGFCNYIFEPLKEGMSDNREKASYQTLRSYEENSDWFFIPVNKRLLRGAGALAATLLSFILLSTPILSNRSEAPQFAGVFPVWKENKVPFSHIKKDTSRFGNSLNSVYRKHEKGDSHTDRNENEKITEERPYHIIIATFYTKKAADNAVKEIRNDFNANVLSFQGSRKFRVVVNDFGDKKKAEEFLNHFIRRFPEYKDAWILKSESKS